MINYVGLHTSFKTDNKLHTFWRYPSIHVLNNYIYITYIYMYVCMCVYIVIIIYLQNDRQTNQNKEMLLKAKSEPY